MVELPIIDIIPKKEDGVRTAAQEVAEPVTRVTTAVESLLHPSLQAAPPAQAAPAPVDSRRGNPSLYLTNCSTRAVWDLIFLGKECLIMNKQMLRILASVSFSLALAASTALLASAQASAQCPAPELISGLRRPIGITKSN
jgi:hypothetical protein